MSLTHPPIEELDPKRYIIIKGARVNNLQNIDLAIKRNSLSVITGVSGSGKSSLAFDTLFAEGQRMYVESLSSYARQFLGRLEKPDVDYIKGISPAIAIEQKVNSRNPRSTVGTTTEIYDYLKLLYARIGKTYSPISGEIVKRHQVEDVVDFILSLPVSTKVQIVAPIVSKRPIREELSVLLQKGFSRIVYHSSVAFIEEVLADDSLNFEDEVYVLIDRIAIQEQDNDPFRIADSVQSAFYEGEGTCIVLYGEDKSISFSDKFELDGISFEEPSVNLFSFNNPYGACKTCDGFGTVLGIDADLIFPDKSLSVYEGAIAPWRSEAMSAWVEPLIKNGIKFDFPIHRSISDLSPKEMEVLWKGNKYFNGLNDFFAYLESQIHKIQYRVLLSRYRGKTICPDCNGTRIRKDASYVLVGGKSIIDLLLMPIDQLSEWMHSLQLEEEDEKVSARIIKEVKSRLHFLELVGLGYLTLNRLSNTLSGGEFQRIKLATSLGSALVGSMYILDEPSIGLHPRDTKKMVEALLSLKKLGNTVIVVEHEEDVMRAADEIIDIGPEAGVNGGKLMFQGPLSELANAKESLTAQYLTNVRSIAVPSVRRPWNNGIRVLGARENNLKNVNTTIPLGIFTCITGVSGSGKSTLMKKIVFPALKRCLGEITDGVLGKYDKIEGSINTIKQVEFVDQHPIGKSSRSNPVTYIKAYDAIRDLYADQALSKLRGYKPAHYSFNVEGGRCEACQGEGSIKVEMQFMADIHLTCEACNGKRFKQEILEVEFKSKSIFDVLSMTVDEALEFFKDQKKIYDKLKPLAQVGLGYIGLGQSSSSLSGGEAQRVKLASFLGKGENEGHTVFFFDEPTTGLHFHDTQKLLTSLQLLVDKGHTVIVIEHNMEVVKCADWVIDLGPEGGDQGGHIVFEGTPEQLADSNKGATWKYLSNKLNQVSSTLNIQ